MTLEQLHAKGFDKSARYGECWNLTDKYIIVDCSQCQALVINGTPCHERGCPNAARAKREQEIEDREEE